MNKIQSLTPVFYARGVNAPYTEGHIQLVRMMTKSFWLYNVRSIIFNFKYGVDGLAVEDEQVSKHRIEQEIPLITRDSLYKFNAPIAAYALSMETLKTLRFFFLESTLKGNGYVINIINCSRYPRMFLRRLSKAPVILHFYMPNIRLRPITRVLIERANMIIASSHTLSRYLRKIGARKEDTVVVYPPIDTEVFKPQKNEAIRSQLGLPTKAKTIVYIGGLKRTRFPEQLVLKAMKKLAKEIPGALLLAFAPRTIQNMDRALEMSSLKSHNVKIYTKNLRDTEKSKIYSLADVFLFPRFSAGTAIEPPLTVLEAMSSGTPVVAPRASPFGEIITNNENGFLFQMNSSEALANKLANVLLDTDLRIRVAQQARQTIRQKASLLVVGEKMIELHRSILNSL